MPNGRCRMHGGESTGPRTLEGRHRIWQAHLTHGWYTNEAVALRREARSTLSALKDLLERASPPS
jgi:hypothetical protein